MADTACVNLDQNLAFLGVFNRHVFDDEGSIDFLDNGSLARLGIFARHGGRFGRECRSVKLLSRSEWSVRGGGLIVVGELGDLFSYLLHRLLIAPNVMLLGKW